MARSVFWSWQSDRPARETRSLIREALVKAIDRIAVEFDEAGRPEIDHDTRGAAGSPDIVATILTKIDRAGVFVADVTPIAISENGKHIANPNVLIELGYAKRALGTERVITVWNTAFTDARPEDLPSDVDRLPSTFRAVPRRPICVKSGTSSPIGWRKQFAPALVQSRCSRACPRRGSRILS